MSKIKLVFSGLTVLGVAGLAALGVGAAAVAPIVTIGVAIGTAIAGLIAMFKR